MRPDDDLVVSLVTKWCETPAPDRPPAEALCAECPELIDAVRAAIACVTRFEEHLQEHLHDGDAEVPAMPDIDGFEVLREVGKGAFGRVFEANDLTLKRRVAIKVLDLGRSPDARRFARMSLEAEAAAALQHKNVVTIHGLGVFKSGVRGELPYLVMEYVEGRRLSDLIAEEPVKPKLAARVVRALADAVHHFHQHGVIHRDLKPDNILVKKEATTTELSPDALKIADFGLAKRLGGDGPAGAASSFAGSPAYMAPEQVRGEGEAAGVLTDVYALGVILYELLTTRRPFESETAYQTLQNIQAPDVLAPSPRQHRRSIPRSIADVCMKCLEKVPERRYQSALEVASDLTRFLDGVPVEAGHTPAPERLLLWCYRNQILSFLIVAGVAALVLVGLLLDSERVRANQETDFARRDAESKGKLVEEETRRVHEVSNALGEVSKALDTSEYNRYLSEMELAERETNLGNVDGARAILERFRPPQPSARYRGWEWSYLRHLSRPALEVIPGYEQVAQCDNGLLVLGGSDGSVVVRDGTKEASFQSGGGRIIELAVSRTGRLVATRHGSEVVSVWDVSSLFATGKAQLRFTRASKGGLIKSIAFSPDEEEFAAAVSRNQKHTVARCRTSDGQAIEDLPQDTTQAATLVCYAPDLNVMYIASPRGFEVVTRRGGRRVASMLVHAGDTSDGFVWRIKASPDGKYLAVASMDSCVRLYRTIPLNLVHTFRGHRAPVESLHFLAGGRSIATGGQDGLIKVWDLETGNEDMTLPGQSTNVVGLAEGRDGTRLYAAYRDGIKAWDCSRPPGHHLLKRFPGNVFGVAVSADGRFLAAGGGQPRQTGSIRLWKLPSGEAMPPLPERHIVPVFNLAFSPVDPDKLVSVDANGKAYKWVVSTGVATSIKGHDHKVATVAFTPDGKRLITGGQSGRVLVSDFPSGDDSVEFSCPNPDRIWDMAISRDGKRVAAGMENGQVAVWDFANPSEPKTYKPFGKNASAIAFHPAGDALAVYSDGTVKLLDVADGRERLALTLDVSSAGALSFHPSGDRLAVGTLREIKLIDVASGRQTLVMRGHGTGVSDVNFSLGKQLVSAGWDQTVRVWQGPNEESASR